MAEPKILPPVLRPHQRYIVFDIISENKISYGDFVGALWESMINFLGEMETAKANAWLIKNLYDEKTQRGVVKCNHNYIESLRVALLLISMIGESRALIRIIGVTGTIKAARLKYFGEKGD